MFGQHGTRLEPPSTAEETTVRPEPGRSLQNVQVLALDTSSPAVSAALVRVAEGTVQVLAERVVVDARRHGELLAQGVQEVLAGGQPDAVVVGTGPGPFTGLRVGLMTAAAIADARGIPAYGVCSLDAMAAGAVVVVADARRKEVYWARYEGGTRVDGPSVGRPADVLALLPAGVPLVGAGAPLLGAEAAEPLHPSLRLLVARAADRVLAGAPSDPLTPLYLRRPDAVEPGAVKRVTA
ncbi:MAG: tRNA ((37)-N6)-threonylcarbamoyltransferase complex dimerization subunit type 1 TsaB [Frankiales bacterium]|nr:tRNA ((37)-N6)-threonylcarbamoyltransferase complex dimerization subunit type 1 TsaB [Frankiales bacterium]